MNITLKKTEVESLEFKKTENPNTKDTIELSFFTGFNDELKRSFAVSFDSSFESKEEGFLLSIKYVAYFETDEDIDEEFKSSYFPLVNAPAIAYPFLRSFISTLTVNAGYSAIMIPTVNFQTLSRKSTPQNQKQPPKSLKTSPSLKPKK